VERCALPAQPLPDGHSIASRTGLALRALVSVVSQRLLESDGLGTAIDQRAGRGLFTPRRPGYGRATLIPCAFAFSTARFSPEPERFASG
jgi:hypothetical protein